MAVRKLKKSWWVDFQVNFTRYRKRSPLNSKAGAEAYEVQMRRALAETGSIEDLSVKPAKQSLPTFGEFAERWLETYVLINNKPSEQRTKRRIVRAFLIPSFGSRLLAEIKTQDIEIFKASQLRRGLSAKTVNNRLAVLGRCLSSAIEWEELAELPKIKLLKTVPPKFRYLRDEEVERLTKAMPNDLESAMMLLAVRTGLRFSELRALEWGDLDLGRRILTVSRCAVAHDVGTPKNGKIRHIPLTSDALIALMRLPRSSELIFPNTGRMFVYWTSLCHLQKACVRAGIEPIGWHVLRHTFASQLISRGASLKAIHDLLGHSTISMTQRYAHLAPEVLKDTISLLEPIKLDSGDSMSAQCQPEVSRNSEGVGQVLQNTSISLPK